MTLSLTFKNKIIKYRAWILLIIFLAGTLVFISNNGHEHLKYENVLLEYTELKNLTQQNIHQAQLIFFLIYLFVVTFSLPFASLLTVLGSALFGWTALLIILFAASFGASLLFIAARTILSDWFYKKTSSQNSIIPPDFKGNTFILLLGLRLFPLAPFWIVNILPAFTKISLRNYFVATFFGIMPGTILYVWLGQTMDMLLSRGEWPNMMSIVDSRIWLPLAGLSLLIFITAIYRWLKT